MWGKKVAEVLYTRGERITISGDKNVRKKGALKRALEIVIINRTLLQQRVSGVPIGRA